MEHIHLSIDAATQDGRRPLPGKEKALQALDVDVDATDVAIRAGA